jgi:FAD/FMN-containing dehydrogenase
MSVEEAVEALNRADRDPAIELIEAHLSIDEARLLNRAVTLTHRATPDLPVPAADLSGDQQTWLRKLALRLSGTGDPAKRLRWFLETHVRPHLEETIVSRNTAMAAPVKFLKNPDPSVTEVLQEYFVPRRQFLPFLARLGELVRKYRINLLNVTLRAVRPDRLALLPYARETMIGAVVYIQLHRTDFAVARLASFTRDVIEQLAGADGSYYLCYGPYFTREQLLRMYPRFGELCRLKRDLDPASRFSSAWWRAITAQAGRT